MNGEAKSPPANLKLLTLTATHLPIEDILHDVLEGRVDQYGEMQLTLNEPHELLLTLKGTSENPILEGKASAGSGRFQFHPTNPDYPELDPVKFRTISRRKLVIPGRGGKIDIRIEQPRF